MVLIDDLQWADAASLSLLEFLHRHAVHLPLLVVGTYRSDEVARPDHPQRQAIADLAQKALTIPLRGLDNDGIRQLRDDLGAPTSTAEAEHLRRLTGGNPFFVIESVAFRDPTESLGVRSAIDRRIDALGESERRVLEIASLIGRENPDVLLATLVGDVQETARAFGVIERSGLMRGGEDSMRSSTISCESRCATGCRLSSDAPCTHRSWMPPTRWSARPVCYPPTSRGLPFRRCRTSPGSGQWPCSRQQLSTRRRGSPTRPPGATSKRLPRLADDHVERGRLTLESGHAYHRAGSLDLARARYLSLLGTSDVEVRARALLGLHRIGDPPRPVRRRPWCGASMPSTPTSRDSTNTGLRAEVLAARSRSRSHLLADDRSDTAALAADALALARSSGDPMTIASCLLAYHDAIWEPGTEAERRAVADELTQTGDALADPAVQAQGLLLRMVAELEVGDPGYRTTHQQFDAVADTARSPRLQYLSMSRRGMAAALGADLATAQTAIDAAREMGERIGEPDTISVWCDQRWQLARHAGDDKTVGVLLETLRANGDPHWMVYDALAAVDRGDVDAATRLAVDVAALGERWPRWAARLWDAFNVQLAVVERREDRIGALVEQLRHDAGHWVVLGGAVLVHGPRHCGWAGSKRQEVSGSRRWRGRPTPKAPPAGSTAISGSSKRALDRLTAEHATGNVDATEVASTLSAALDPAGSYRSASGCRRCHRATSTRAL